MFRSISRFLASISLIALVGCAAPLSVGSSVSNAAIVALDEPSQYRLIITGDGFELSGVLICRLVDGQVVGAVVNEFGIKAFDIVSKGSRCRLINVIGVLDRCLVRRSIEGDMTMLLLTDTSSVVVEEEGSRRVVSGKRQTIFNADRSVVLLNSRSKMQYTLIKI